MTDSTEEDDPVPSETPVGSHLDSEVPVDVEWELANQVPFDEGESHDLTSAIVVGVAETEGVSPLDVTDPPLYEVLDVAALEDAFFGSSIASRRDEDLRSVEFMYRGHRVVVRSDAWVQIYRPTAD